MHRLRADPRVEVVGLLTTVTTTYDRISIHGVRRSLLQQQAAALQLPVHEIEIAPQSSNHDYEAAWASSLARLSGPMRDARTIAFGDIFLEDVRTYRERMTQSLGFTSTFPLWGESTQALAVEVVELGFVARIVCVDTQGLPAGRAAGLAGALFDADLLDALPAGVDPCGERGEFHTFVSDGPGFDAPVQHRIGETVLREGRFLYCDLIAEAPI